MAKTVKISHRTWGKIRGMLESQNGPQTSVLPRSMGSTLVRIQNTSGDPVDRCGILGISGSVIDPMVNFLEFQRHIVLTGATPSTQHHSGGRFVICAEPIPSGNIGLAYAAGVCQVKISVSNAAHRYADVLNGNHSVLASAESGTCTILWRQSGTGSKWAIVRFGGGAGGGTTTTRWFYVDNIIGENTLSCREATYNVEFGSWLPISGSPPITVRLTPQMNTSHFRAQNIIAAAQIPTSGAGGGEPVWVAHYSQPSAFQEL